MKESLFNTLRNFADESLFEGDEIVKVDPGRRILFDAVDSARRPDGFATMLVDLLPAKEFKDAFRKRHGVPLTYLHMLIKACTLIMKKYPWTNYMIERYRVIHPSSIDVGISVAGEEVITPVVIIREADKKSLIEIVEEFRRKTAEAIRDEEKNLEKLRKIGRLLPINFLRRMVIRYLAQSYRLRRQVVGTVQISMMNTKETDLFIPMTMGTAVLMGVGGVANRPVAVGDKVEVRPSVYVTLLIDHRVWHPLHASELSKELRWIMEHPEELEKTE
jgi:2-oxoglutarate dehydrogenase E2 component (dihydrolipoamide succinyltransferase)